MDNMGEMNPGEHHGGGGNGMDAGDLYNMYGVPHHASRLSPAPFPTHPHYNNRTSPEVYEFEYEEPHFT